MVEQGCNIDYSTCDMPDAFVAALSTGGSTIKHFIPYSIACEPLELIKFAKQANILDRIPVTVRSHLFFILLTLYIN